METGLYFCPIVQVKFCFCFLRSGFTMASVKTEGKTPVCRDLLIMAVTAGSSWSKHSTKRDVGIGSSEQVFREDFKIVCLTHWIDTGWKEQNADSVYGSSVGKFSVGIWLSNSSRIDFLDRVIGKCVRNFSSRNGGRKRWIGFATAKFVTNTEQFFAAAALCYLRREVVCLCLVNNVCNSCLQQPLCAISEEK